MSILKKLWNHKKTKRYKYISLKVAKLDGKTIEKAQELSIMIENVASIQGVS